MTLSTTAILERLAEIRVQRIRAPVEVLQLGQRLVESGEINRRSEQGWIVKEQLAFAAIECGQPDLASVLIDRLTAEFTETSPRVIALKGSLLEHQQHLDQARLLYEQRLKQSDADILIRKRLIALHLSIPDSRSTPLLSRQEGIRLLVEYLDSTYLDAEGWILLSQQYSQLALFDQALTSLNHAVLLQPQNPFILLHHAELVVTLNRFELALQECLRVIEMTTDLDIKSQERTLAGVGVRAAFVAKLCINRIKSDSKNATMTKERSNELEVMLTKLILKSYSQRNERSKQSLGVVRDWLSSS